MKTSNRLLAMILSFFMLFSLVSEPSIAMATSLAQNEEGGIVKEDSSEGLPGKVVGNKKVFALDKTLLPSPKKTQSGVGLFRAPATNTNVTLITKGLNGGTDTFDWSQFSNGNFKVWFEVNGTRVGQSAVTFTENGSTTQTINVAWPENATIDTAAIVAEFDGNYDLRVEPGYTNSEGANGGLEFTLTAYEVPNTKVKVEYQDIYGNPLEDTNLPTTLNQDVNVANQTPTFKLPLENAEFNLRDGDSLVKAFGEDDAPYDLLEALKAEVLNALDGSMGVKINNDITGELADGTAQDAKNYKYTIEQTTKKVPTVITLTYQADVAVPPKGDDGEPVTTPPGYTRITFDANENKQDGVNGTFTNEGPYKDKQLSYIDVKDSVEYNNATLKQLIAALAVKGENEEKQNPTTPWDPKVPDSGSVKDGTNKKYNAKYKAVVVPGDEKPTKPDPDNPGQTIPDDEYVQIKFDANDGEFEPADAETSYWVLKDSTIENIKAYKEVPAGQTAAEVVFKIPTAKKDGQEYTAWTEGTTDYAKDLKDYATAFTADVTTFKAKYKKTVVPGDEKPTKPDPDNPGQTIPDDEYVQIKFDANDGEFEPADAETSYWVLKDSTIENIKAYKEVPAGQTAAEVVFKIPTAKKDGQEYTAWTEGTTDYAKDLKDYATAFTADVTTFKAKYKKTVVPGDEKPTKPDPDNPGQTIPDDEYVQIKFDANDGEFEPADAETSYWVLKDSTIENIKAYKEVPAGQTAAEVVFKIPTAKKDGQEYTAWTEGTTDYAKDLKDYATAFTADVTTFKAKYKKTVVPGDEKPTKPDPDNPGQTIPDDEYVQIKFDANDGEFEPADAETSYWVLKDSTIENIKAYKEVPAGQTAAEVVFKIPTAKKDGQEYTAWTEGTTDYAKDLKDYATAFTADVTTFKAKYKKTVVPGDEKPTKPDPDNPGQTIPDDEYVQIKFDANDGEFEPADAETSYWVLKDSTIENIKAYKEVPAGQTAAEVVFKIPTAKKDGQEYTAWTEGTTDYAKDLKDYATAFTADVTTFKAKYKKTVVPGDEKPTKPDPDNPGQTIPDDEYVQIKFDANDGEFEPADAETSYWVLKDSTIENIKAYKEVPAGQTAAEVVFKIPTAKKDGQEYTAWTEGTTDYAKDLKDYATAFTADVTTFKAKYKKTVVPGDEKPTKPDPDNPGQTIPDDEYVQIKFDANDGEFEPADAETSYWVLKDSTIENIKAYKEVPAGQTAAEVVFKIPTAKKDGQEYTAWTEGTTDYAKDLKDYATAFTADVTTFKAKYKKTVVPGDEKPTKPDPDNPGQTIPDDEYVQIKFDANDGEFEPADAETSYWVLKDSTIENIKAYKEVPAGQTAAEVVFKIPTAKKDGQEYTAWTEGTTDYAKDLKDYATAFTADVTTFKAKYKKTVVPGDEKPTKPDPDNPGQTIPDDEYVQIKFDANDGEFEPADAETSYWVLKDSTIENIKAYKEVPAGQTAAEVVFKIPTAKKDGQEYTAWTEGTTDYAKDLKDYATAFTADVTTFKAKYKKTVVPGDEKPTKPDPDNPGQTIPDDEYVQIKFDANDGEFEPADAETSYWVLKDSTIENIKAYKEVPAGQTAAEVVFKIPTAKKDGQEYTAWTEGTTDYAKDLKDYATAFTADVTTFKAKYKKTVVPGDEKPTKPDPDNPGQTIPDDEYVQIKFDANDGEFEPADAETSYWVLKDSTIENIKAYKEVPAGQTAAEVVFKIPTAKKDGQEYTAWTEGTTDYAKDLKDYATAFTADVTTFKAKYKKTVVPGDEKPTKPDPDNPGQTIPDDEYVQIKFDANDGEFEPADAETSYWVLKDSTIENIKAYKEVPAGQTAAEVVFKIPTAKKDGQEYTAWTEGTTDYAKDLKDYATAFTADVTTFKAKYKKTVVPGDEKPTKPDPDNPGQTIPDDEYVQIKFDANDGEFEPADAETSYWVLKDSTIENIKAYKEVPAGQTAAEVVFKIPTAKKDGQEYTAWTEGTTDYAKDLKDYATAFTADVTTFKAKYKKTVVPGDEKPTKPDPDNPGQTIPDDEYVQIKFDANDGEFEPADAETSYWVLKDSTIENIKAYKEVPAGQTAAEVVFKIPTAKKDGQEYTAWTEGTTDYAKDLKDYATAFTADVTTFKAKYKKTVVPGDEKPTKPDPDNPGQTIPDDEYVQIKFDANDGEFEPADAETSYWVLKDSTIENIKAYKEVPAGQTAAEVVFKIPTAKKDGQEYTAWTEGTTDYAKDLKDYATAFTADVTTFKAKYKKTVVPGDEKPTKPDPDNPGQTIPDDEYVQIKFDANDGEFEPADAETSYWVLKDSTIENIKAYKEVPAGQTAAEVVFKIPTAKKDGQEYTAWTEGTTDYAKDLKDYATAFTADVTTFKAKYKKTVVPGDEKPTKPDPDNPGQTIPDDEYVQIKFDANDGEFEPADAETSYWVLKDSTIENIKAYKEVPAGQTAAEVVFKIPTAKKDGQEYTAWTEGTTDYAKDLKDYATAFTADVTTFKAKYKKTVVPGDEKPTKPDPDNPGQTIPDDEYVQIKFDANDGEFEPADAETSYWVLKDSTIENIKAYKEVPAGQTAAEVVFKIPTAKKDGQEYTAWTEGTTDYAKDLKDYATAFTADVTTFKAKYKAETTPTDQSKTPTIDQPYEGDDKITGKGEPGAKIEVKDGGGNKIGETTVKPDKTWEVDVPQNKPLKKGDKITATQTETGMRPSEEAEATVKGKYTPPTYKYTTLTLDENYRGGEITHHDVLEGDLIERYLYVPRRRGYVFEGWSYNSRRLDEVRPGDRIYYPTTLYAIWAKDRDYDRDEREEEPEDLRPVHDHNAYMFGYTDGTVRPNGKITRAEAAALVTRLLGLDTFASAAKPMFSDTPSSWYNKAINAAVQRGIMKGYPDGRFRPNAPITRAEFTQMISTIDNKPYGVAPFADVKGHWAERPIGSEYQAGRIMGYPDQTFRPNAFITRCEAVVILNKMFERNYDAMSLKDAKNAYLIKGFLDLPTSFWGYYDMIEATNSHSFKRRVQGKVQEDWTLVK